MPAAPVWTCLFYIFVLILAVAPVPFVLHYWREARALDWNWISEDSRNMYVDGAKTLITASGIAVALLASSSVASAKTAHPLVAFSAKVAVVCLISCVCLSLIVILRAQSRYIDEQRKAGQEPIAGEGKLNTGELLFLLVPTGLALSCFLVGFLFLGRIAFHF